MAKFGVGKTVESLGDYLREQRLAAKLSLRQLAEQAGVSNPYLSQIERGLRKPSAEVLQQLAKALRISAETLYVRAGILDPQDGEVRSVELAILADTGLTERQKQSLLDVYQSFRAANVQSPRRKLKMATTKNKQFKFDATRPFYAAVGAGDLAIELARTTAVDVQSRVAKVELEPKALRDQAVTLVSTRVEELQGDAKKAQTALEARIAELQADAKALPEKIEKLIAEYVAELNKTVEELNKTYAELAGRGQDFVARVRKQEATKQTKAAAKATTAKAKTTGTQAKKSAKSTGAQAKKSAKTTTAAAKKSAKPAASSAKATGTAAKKTTSSAAQATSDAASKAGN